MNDKIPKICLMKNCKNRENATVQIGFLWFCKADAVAYRQTRGLYK